MSEVKYRSNKYKFDKMKVGQAFKVPKAGEVTSDGYYDKSLARTWAARNYYENNVDPSAVFSVVEHKDAIFCKRVA